MSNAHPNAADVAEAEERYAALKHDVNFGAVHLTDLAHEAEADYEATLATFHARQREARKAAR